jgi:hypothetical protein
MSLAALDNDRIAPAPRKRLSGWTIAMVVYAMVF